MEGDESVPLRVAPAQPVVHERGIAIASHIGEGVAAVRGVGDARDPIIARRDDLRIGVAKRGAQQHDAVGPFVLPLSAVPAAVPGPVVIGLRALQIGDPAPVRTP